MGMNAKATSKRQQHTNTHTQTNSHGKHSIYAYDAAVQSSLWYNTADKGLVGLCAPHNVEPLQWKNVNIIDLTWKRFSKRWKTKAEPTTINRNLYHTNTKQTKLFYLVSYSVFPFGVVVVAGFFWVRRGGWWTNCVSKWDAARMTALNSILCNVFQIVFTLWRWRVNALFSKTAQRQMTNWIKMEITYEKWSEKTTKLCEHKTHTHTHISLLRANRTSAINVAPGLVLVMW